MKFVSKVLLVIAFTLAGCSFDVSDVQSIDIETYPDTERNVKLAEDLTYYDHRYIAYKVPSFNEATAKGIKLGYFIRSSDGKPSYRVTYNMQVSAVAKNIDLLKSGFETYIPKLAAFHASKSEVFSFLKPKGQAWAHSLFERSSREILSTSSSLLRESITSEQLDTTITNMSSEYGTPLSTEFLRAQYYESFGGIPESVSLFYLQTYSNGKKSLTRVSYTQENGDWTVMGFDIYQHA